MSEAIVQILDAKGKTEREIHIRVNGHDANFTLQFDKLAVRFLRNIDDRLLDLIDIASCIFAADSRIGRGGPTRRNFGAAWRRRLRFQFYVRDLDFWCQNEISGALRDAVQFMSDDICDIEFVAAKRFPPLQSILDIGASNPVFTASDVIMFSGGLDSLSGAYEKLCTTNDNVILISHSSAPKRDKYPRELFAQLAQKFPSRILWIPVLARLKGEEAAETTQRTRSFLFACLGYLAARLSGATSLHFYENGIVSANLPISQQVIGSMASRTTHPQTLSAISALLKRLSPEEVKLGNPYANLTKAQVVGRLAEYGGAELIRRTVSCSHVLEQTILHPHCGECSQCVDRRFGVLAAGLDQYDPAEGYQIDILTGARTAERSRILAFDWTRHALRLASMSELDFAVRFGNDLARLVAADPYTPSSENARAIVAMHKLHGEGVKRVLSELTAANSSRIISQSLPSTSLLRMIMADLTAISSEGSSISPPLETGQVLSPQIEAAIGPKVVISGSAQAASVEIIGLETIGGVNATPAWALAKWHLAEKQTLGEIDDFRFVAGGEVSQCLGISKGVLRARVKRLRDGFAEYYYAIEGHQPSEHILIQSKITQKYRIDPTYSLELKDHLDL